MTTMNLTRPRDAKLDDYDCELPALRINPAEIVRLKFFHGGACPVSSSLRIMRLCSSTWHVSARILSLVIIVSRPRIWPPFAIIVLKQRALFLRWFFRNMSYVNFLEHVALMRHLFLHWDLHIVASAKSTVPLPSGPRDAPAQFFPAYFQPTVICENCLF